MRTAPRWSLSRSGYFFFGGLVRSTTCVRGFDSAFLTVVNRPVSALRPILPPPAFFDIATSASWSPGMPRAWVW